MKFFQKNLGLKITSVVLAIAVWAFVISLGQSGITIEAPVVFTDIPPGLAVSGGDRHVSISVRGHERFIRDLRPEDISISVSLKGAARGERAVDIRRGNIVLPTPLRIASISPSSFSVSLEEALRKAVPVHATYSGSPAKGYAVTAVLAMPPDVHVEGLRSTLRDIDAIEAEPVVITNARADVTAEVRLNIPADTSGISVPTAKVTVRIQREGR